MKTTWRNLQNFAATAEAYLAAHQGESKISYAIKRVRDQITGHAEELQLLMSDIEIDLCVVADVGNTKEVIQRDAAGNLQFTRDGLRERAKRQRALLDHEFEIEPFYVSKWPEDLTPSQLAAFSGLIIPDQLELEVPGADPEEAAAGVTN